MQNKALIRNAVRIDSEKYSPKGPHSYEAVAELLEWAAAELRRTKENVITLPEFNVRVEDSRGTIFGIGLSIIVERGDNYEKRLKQINAN